MDRTTSKVQDVAGQAASKVQDVAGQAGSTVQDVAGQAAGTVQSAADTAKDTAGQVVDNARQGVQHVAHQAQYRAERVGSRIGEMMQENPLVIGAAAVALGAIVGFAFPATEKENEIMGEARDRVMDRAQEVASETAEKVQHVAQEAATAAKETAKDEAQKQNLASGSGMNRKNVYAGPLAGAQCMRNQVSRPARRPMKPGFFWEPNGQLLLGVSVEEGLSVLVHPVTRRSSSAPRARGSSLRTSAPAPRSRRCASPD